MRIYRSMQAKGEPFSPRDLYYFANELFDHQLYEEACDYYQRFLETGLGWVEDNIQACLKLAHCYRMLNNHEKVFHSLCRSFQFDKPRGEVCYLLGEYFLERQQIDLAVFWFNFALLLPVPKETMGLRNTAMTTWMPHLQLAVCYAKKQKYDLANLHNELAAKYVPDHASVQHNRHYFQRVLGEQGEHISKHNTSTDTQVQ